MTYTTVALGTERESHRQVGTFVPTIEQLPRNRESMTFLNGEGLCN
jgi:hypothetical protein